MRTQNIDEFVLASKTITNWSNNSALFNNNNDSDYLTINENDVLDNELSITQIQKIMQNEHMSKQREKEALFNLNNFYIYIIIFR